MQNIKSLQDFIEKYYPKYSSCDSVALNNDLAMIIEGEHEESEAASNLLHVDYANNPDDPHIRIDFLNSELIIVREALQAFIDLESQKPSVYVVYGKALCRALDDGFNSLFHAVNVEPGDWKKYEPDTSIAKILSDANGWDESKIVDVDDYKLLNAIQAYINSEFKIDPMVTIDGLLSKLIKIELVNMAVDDSLPSDMTELDMDGVIEKVKSHKLYKLYESFERWKMITTYQDGLDSAVHFYHFMNSNHENDFNIASNIYSMHADHNDWTLDMVAAHVV